MSLHTRSQRFAQVAFARIQERKKALNAEGFKEYSTFSKKFPSLIHTCGLAQAVAFASAKKENDYLDDLTQVLQATQNQTSQNSRIRDTSKFLEETRTLELAGYLLLSNEALVAAGWLKRYVEALQEK